MEYQKIVDSVNLKSPSTEKFPASGCRIVGLETTNADELIAAGQHSCKCVDRTVAPRCIYHTWQKLHLVVPLCSDTPNALPSVADRWHSGNLAVAQSPPVYQFAGLPLLMWWGKVFQPCAFSSHQIRCCFFLVFSSNLWGAHCKLSFLLISWQKCHQTAAA